MKTRPSVVITTRLPPQTCGIGTYSWLAFQNRPQNSVPVEFLVLEGAVESRTQLQWNAITDFNGNPASLAQALDRVGSANVLLHYAGRAYQRFGCPMWMPGVLGKWKKRFPTSRLTIFFHEVPGRLPTWSRHFLLGKIGEGILRRLLGLADVVATNTQNHAEILRRLSGDREIHYLPVGSNIAPAASSPEPRLMTEFVVFGLPFGRFQTLQLFDREIRRWLANGRLTMLHLVGPMDEEFASRADELVSAWPQHAAVVRHGLLPEKEISSLLARAGFALTNVTADTWSKSGVFMACAVIGCAAVIKSEMSNAAAPLSYAICANEVDKISEAELVSRTVSLKAWYYQNADWKVTGERLAILSENRQQTL